MEVIEIVMNTVHKTYVEIIEKLSPEEKLRLAAWILDDLTEDDRSGWRSLSAERERAVWDNPIDAEDWDNWQPPKGRKGRLSLDLP